jgi:Spy/CpxP family protein refolding chaperone
MKKLTSLKAIALAVLTVAGLHSFAQEKADRRAGAEERKEQHDERFAEASKKLNLTPEQQTKIKDIMQQSRKSMKEFREANKDKAKEEKRTAMMSEMKKKDASITAVLDSKQQAIYKQMKADRKEEMKKRRADKVKMEDDMGDYGGGIF